jgi:hypothetical protein
MMLLAAEPLQFLSIERYAEATVREPEMQPMAPQPDHVPAPKGWTWNELAKRFQATLKEVRVTKTGRIKHPRRGTQDDVRLAFARPSIAALATL